MSEMKEELKPCPFCGSNNVIIMRSRDEGASHPFRFLCLDNDCMVCDSDAETPALAIRAWNTRADAEGWRPIESAPRDGTPILAWCDHTKDPRTLDAGKTLTDFGAYSECGFAVYHKGECCVVCWAEGPEDLPDYWFVADDDMEYAAHPTHWRPLPAPPEGE